MSILTAENIVNLYVKLPLGERSRVRELIAQEEEREQLPVKPPRDKRLPPKPMPAGGMEALDWIAAHRREYAGQWVALAGDRLIAHGLDYDEVWAAANADGAHLPMVTFVEDPDHIVHIIWT